MPPDAEPTNSGGPPGNGGSVAPSSAEEGLREALVAERGRRQAAEEQLASLKANSDGGQKPERVYTRAELATSVEGGQLTQEEADRLLDRQTETRAAEIAREAARETVAGDARTSAVTTELAEYTTLLPEVATPGSDQRKRLQTKYDELTGIRGYPDSLDTQRLALEMVFGPLTTLRKSQELPRPGHPEVGSGDGGEAGAQEGASADGKPKGLTARESEYYTPRVGPGKMYKNWGEVGKLLEKHGDPDRSKRMGGRSVGPPLHA